MVVAFIGVTSIVSATNRATLLVLLTAAMVTAGCAATNPGNDPPPGAPPMIYVENFDLGAATVKADPHTLTGRRRVIDFGDSDPAQKLQELSDLLAKSLVEDL